MINPVLWFFHPDDHSLIIQYEYYINSYILLLFFFVNLGSGTSTNPCSDTYGGASAGSGVETNLVQNKLNGLSNVHGVISYHAYARMWLHAYGYTTSPGGSQCATSPNHNAIVSHTFHFNSSIVNTIGINADIKQHHYSLKQEKTFFNVLLMFSCCLQNAVALAARNAVQSTGGQSWTYGPVCTVICMFSNSC